MLRVHDLTGVSLAPSIAFQSITFNKSTVNDVWAFSIIPMMNLNGNVSEYRFGGIEPDIFGEDITYPKSGLYHKWTSIRQFTVEGDLYPFFQSEVEGLVGQISKTRKYINVLTGTGYYQAIFMPYGRNASIYADLADTMERYGGSNLGADKVLFGCIVRYLGDGIYAFAQIGPYYLFHRKDGWSFSQYQSEPLRTLTTGSLSFYRYEEFSGRWYGSNPRTRPFNQTTSISAEWGDDVVYRAAAWLEEMANLHYHELTWYTRQKLLSMQTLGWHRNIVPSCPNFEAIFSEERRNPNWSQLASQAYQSLGMSDINGVAYLHDLIEMGSQVRSFANTLKSLPSSKVKAAASAWLAVHYGFKLMLLDTKTLLDTLEKESLRNSRKSKCQAATSWVSPDGVFYTARYQVFYNQFAKIQSELSQLQELTDASLTSENVWDMVPFSFVIDWFVRVGDVLQSLDNFANLIQKHDVIAAGRSIKGTVMAKASQLGLPDGVYLYGAEIRCYFRRYSRYLQSPSFLPSVTVNPFNHLIEAAALYISIK